MRKKNKKLTLSIDEKVIAKAKKYAERSNDSLSHIVEQYLDRVSNSTDPKYLKKVLGEEPSPWIKRLAGCMPMQISDEEVDKIVRESIEKKYG